MRNTVLVLLVISFVGAYIYSNNTNPINSERLSTTNNIANKQIKNLELETKQRILNTNDYFVDSKLINDDETNSNAKIVTV